MKSFLLSFFVTLSVGGLLFGFSYKEENVVIKVNNPYGFDIKAELKCDWNEEAGQFDLKKNYLFPAYKKTKIIIPKQFLQCEVWPMLKIF